MSETSILTPSAEAPARHAPTVYFIDDSATMREVIKIAFRRESINVVTCADAGAALEQFEETPPDAVITDVIMPDRDGYEVCNHIKQHPKFSATPVILMSGVVNKSVAEKAIAVKADELIRKPFQPQELISRVKGLLQPKPALAAAEATQKPRAEGPAPGTKPAAPSHPGGAYAPPPAPGPSAVPPPPAPLFDETAWPKALAEAFSQRPSGPASTSVQRPAPTGAAADVQRLKSEILRLELLVKKLQTELTIERQYCQALELQIKTLQETLGS
jgi:CheY-like chemotaxis protein